MVGYSTAQILRHPVPETCFLLLNISTIFLYDGTESIKNNDLEIID